MLDSMFQSGYLFDWEWPYNDNEDGEVYQVGYYWDATQHVCTYKWEPQHLDSVTPSAKCLGETYTSPWECWVIGTPAEPPPFHMPSSFYRAKFVAWDKKPLSHITQKQKLDRDISWRARQG
ncbi:unnamed protein product, partial [marine sediment metagenome]